MNNKEMLEKKAIEMLNNDADLFVEMVNELDTWNGFADGFRAYPMYEMDELFGDMKVSEFLDKLASGFNHRDEYFVDTIYGIDSTDDIAKLYAENVSEEELLENIVDNYGNIYINDSDFEELIEALTECEA